MNISLAAEPVFTVAGIHITNSIFTTWIIIAILVFLAFIIGKSLTKTPKRTQSFLEIVYGWLFEMTEKIIGRKDVAKMVFPYLMTIFFFVVFSNWSGLLPGISSIGLNEVHKGKEILIPLFRAPTSDLNMVVAMAVLTVVFIQVLGFKYAGFKGYASKFFNFKGPIEFYVGIIELISEFTRILSFSFRLFGNVFAGEVLIGVIFFLTTTLMPFVPILPLPFYFLEMFVGLVQAFIFCFLTMVFAAMAAQPHEGHSKEHHKHQESLSLEKPTLDLINK